MRILLYLSILSFFYACENDLADVAAVFQEERQTNVEIAKEITMLYSDSAIVRVKLTAPILVRHLEKRNPFQEYPQGMFVEFYNDYAKKQGQITSKYGLRYEDKNQVILQDSVVWISTIGDKLESEELIWDDEKHLVYSDKWVKITQPGKEIVYSYGFQANEDFSYWKLKSMEGSIPSESFKKEEGKTPNSD